MANQLMKKFIANNAIDETKIQLNVGGALKGLAQDGVTVVELLKLGSADELLVKGLQVATKAMVDAEETARQSADLAAIAEAKAYADQKVADLIDNAPALLDTLKEIAQAINNDPDIFNTLVAQIGVVSAGLAQELLDRAAADLQVLADAKAYADSKDVVTLASANSYTDAQIAAIPAVDLTPYFKKDGSIAMTGDLDVNNHDLLKVGTANFNAGAGQFAYVNGNAGSLAVSFDAPNGSLNVFGKVNLEGNLIINVADGVDATDAATKGQVDAEATRALAAEAQVLADAEAYTDVEVLGERTRALAAEGALDTRVTALEALQHIPYKKTLVAGDITAGYIDLPHLAVAGSTVAFADRLAIHEGASEDYTVSTVGGVTRITFLNDLVNPGQSALAAGDTIYVKYVK